MSAPKPVRPGDACLFYRDGVRCAAQANHAGDHRYPTTEAQVACKHCGRPIANFQHLEGRQRGLMRCDSLDSGLPYGYNAEAPDEPCTIACLGSSAATTEATS